MRKLWLFLLAIPLLLGAGKIKVPTGELTLVSTSPDVVFTATHSHIGRTGHIWVSLSCWDESNNRVYYGEEVERNGQYVMDDSVWVLWTPGAKPQPGNTCRAFLLFKDDRQAGEFVIDDSGFFVVV
jgi:hypothetical protein